jgi:hypothetical protein
MKDFGYIVRLFVMGFVLFQANCVYSAEPTKIQVGEKVNVDFLHHKNLELKKNELGIHYISIHRCYLTKDTFTCYLTYPLSDQEHKKNEFKWDGCILAIPKKNSKYGRLFSQELGFSPMKEIFVNNDSCVVNFDLYMYYIPFDNLYLEGYSYIDDEGNPIPHYGLKKDGEISILKYENKVWIKKGETWTDGSNWKGPCMRDAKKVLSKMYGD